MKANILHETENLHLVSTHEGLEIRLNGATHSVSVGKPKDIDAAMRAMPRLERGITNLRAMYRHW